MMNFCSPFPAIVSGVVGIVLGWLVGRWAESEDEERSTKE